MNKLLSFLLLMFVSAITNSPTSYAQGGGADSGSAANPVTIAPQPCDPQFYAQMNARAWQESEREIMQNQNLIFKADSVLEYTCFDRFANVTAWAGGDIFTHTKYFGGDELIPRNPTYGLENILQNIIGSTEGTPLYNYAHLPDVAAFDHSFLGGRGEFVGLAQPPGRPFDDIRLRRPYECGVMAEVWEKAKCLNFVDNVDFRETDGFYPFDTLECAPGTDCTPIEGYDERIDVRVYPENLRCNSELGLFSWEVAEEKASNQPEVYPFQSPLGETFLDVLDKTLPGLCKAANTVPTGVTVVLSGGPSHRDGVCTNPGCTYTAPGGGGPGGSGLGVCQ